MPVVSVLGGGVKVRGSASKSFPTLYRVGGQNLSQKPNETNNGGGEEEEKAEEGEKEKDEKEEEHEEEKRKVVPSTPTQEKRSVKLGREDAPRPSALSSIPRESPHCRRREPTSVDGLLAFICWKEDHGCGLPQRSERCCQHPQA